MAAANRRGYAGSIVRLVEAGLIEADRKGVHRTRLGLAGKCRHSARVDPARQKDSERSVRDELHPHRVCQFLTQLVLRRAAHRRRGRFPIALNRVGIGVLRTLAGADGQDACCRQQLDSFSNGGGTDHKALGQVRGDTGRVQPAFDDTAREQRSHFGREQEDLLSERAVPHRGPIQRLDSHVIAHQVHAARTWVPDAHREDTAQARHNGEPPTLVRLKYDLRVGGRMELLSERLQFAPKVLEIVDLTIESDDTPGGSINHRLSTGLAEVEDREAAVAKHHFARLCGPMAGAVGSAVPQRKADTIDAGRYRAAYRYDIESGRRKVAYGTGDSTHCDLLTSSATAAALAPDWVWP